MKELLFREAEHVFRVELPGQHKYAEVLWLDPEIATEPLNAISQDSILVLVSVLFEESIDFVLGVLSIVRMTRSLALDASAPQDGDLQFLGEGEVLVGVGLSGVVGRVEAPPVAVAVAGAHPRLLVGDFRVSVNVRELVLVGLGGGRLVGWTARKALTH